MPINWTNLKNIKAKQAVLSEHCFGAYGDDYSKTYHWDDTLPDEAVLMSRTGRAKGYDPLRFGEDHSYLIPVAEITATGVQFLIWSDREKAWIEEVESYSTRKHARMEMVRKWNWTSWEELLPINHEFLLSLLWIPEDPFTAMEILARATAD
jgi:hypothetical protein